VRSQLTLGPAHRQKLTVTTSFLHPCLCPLRKHFAHTMPRNNAPAQSRPRRPVAVRTAGPPAVPRNRPAPSSSRGGGRQPSRKPTGVVTETFTIPLGDVVVKKSASATATAASLLPSSANLPSVYTQIRGYSLHRPLSARVTYRPAATDQAGQMAMAYDPALGDLVKTPAALRGYETTAGGLVGAPHTLTIPGHAFSHVAWTSWVGPSPSCPGFALLCASIPAASTTDVTLGSLELHLTLQSKSRRPLPS